MVKFFKNDNASPIRTFADDLKAAQAVKDSPIKKTEGKIDATEKEGVTNPAIDSENKIEQSEVTKPIRPPSHKKSNRSAADYLTKSVVTKDDENETAPPVAEKKIAIPEESLDEEVKKIATLSGKVVLGDENSTVDMETMGDGTIVQDKKVRRHRLFPSVFKATKSWAEETKESINEVRKPEYTVEKAEKRTDTIKAAAQNSKQVPKEDFDVVVKKFQEVERTPQQPVIKIKDKDEIKVPEPTWSSISETEEKEAPTPKIKEEIETPPVIEETQQLAQEEKIETAPPTAPTVPTPPTQTTATEKTTGAVPQDIPTQTIAIANKQKNVANKKIRFSISEIPLYVIVIVIVVVCLIGIGTSLFIVFNAKQDNAVVMEEPVKTSPFGEATIDSTYTTSKDALVRTMSTKSIHGSGLRTIRFVNKEEQEVPSLNAAQVILEASGIKLIERSVDSATFGFTSDSGAFIVFSGGNFDTSFAGMLAWEETLSKDLAPLFGEYNKRKYVDAAYGHNGSKTARVLLGQSNEQQLAYLVLSSGTIIIASNIENIATIEKLLKQ